MTEREEPELPWLPIAAALVVLGVVVATGLSTVGSPPEPQPPRLVQRELVDMGDWDPFAPTAQEGVAEALQRASNAIAE